MTLLLIGTGILSLYWSKNHISSILQAVIDQLQNTLATRGGLQEHPSSQAITGPETTRHKSDLEHLEQTVTRTVGLLKTQSSVLQNSTSAMERTIKERTKALLETKRSLETEIQERQLASE